MTDYSPAALDALIERIAHAAITRMMHDHGWHGSAADGFYAYCYEGQLPPVSGPTGVVTLHQIDGVNIDGTTRPDVGELVGSAPDAFGYVQYRWRVNPWTDLYQPWIEAIESAFANWETLPDPADFEGPVGSVRQAVLELDPTPTARGGDSGGRFASDLINVELANEFRLLDEWVGPSTQGADQGLLVFAFDRSYGGARIRDVMQNQAQAAVLLGVSLLGEQRIWRQTRRDIMALGEAAVDAFDPYGRGGSIDLKVVQAFVNLLNAFAPPPLKPILTGTSAALGLVDALLPAEDSPEVEVRIDGGTADEVYQSMREAIRSLEQQVYDKEYELVTALRGLLAEMRGGSASRFHIHPDSGIDTDLAEAPAIDVNTEYLKRIGYQTVPSIAAFMGRAAEHAQAADRAGIWQRGGSIGYGSSGPYQRWVEVLGVFDAVVTGSARELVDAGALLAAGAGFLEDSDGHAEQALSGVHDDLERGRDGWDNSRVGLPPPRPAPVGGWAVPW